MCKGIDNLYPPLNQVIRKEKVMELVIGRNVKGQVLKNIMELASGMLAMFDLDGDLELSCAYEGDTLYVFRQVFEFKEHVLPISYN